MKKLLIATILTAALGLCCQAAYSDSKIITLKDGSRINGRLVAVAGGKYFIQSPGLGELRIKEEDVVSITSADSQPQHESSDGANPRQAPAPAHSGYAAQIQAAQNQLMANPQNMADLAALASDPEVMSAMNDPAFMSAVQSQDLKALQNNPRMNKLLNNPRIKAMIQQLQGGTQQRR